MINIEKDKNHAIKAVRQYCLEAFGVESGLKETKDFVESIIPQQQPKILDLETVRRIRSLLEDIGVEYTSFKTQSIVSTLKEYFK